MELKVGTDHFFAPVKAAKTRTLEARWKWWWWALKHFLQLTVAERVLRPTNGPLLTAQIWVALIGQEGWHALVESI